MSVWESDETLLSICILNFSFKSSKFVKNTPLRVVFSTLFSVFHLVMKHCISCLIYYLIVYRVVEKGLATVTFYTVKSRNRRSISAPLTKNKNKTKTYKLAY